MSINNKTYYGYIYKIACLVNKRCYAGQKRKSIYEEDLL